MNEEELKAQVEALRAQLDRERHKGQTPMRECIIGAAREAAHTKGGGTQLEDVRVLRRSQGRHSGTRFSSRPSIAPSASVAPPRLC